jgi:hypothetical protein
MDDASVDRILKDSAVNMELAMTQFSLSISASSMCPSSRQNAEDGFLLEPANPIPQLFHIDLWIVNSIVLPVK